jgi:multimeric flavodoxin WrbA
MGDHHGAAAKVAQPVGADKSEGGLMKVIAINGSPRKNWNTATLLKQALKGSASKGAQTELVHLYDLDFKGCTSCFACKQVGGKHEGHCAIQDGATHYLQKIDAEADVILLGSPIYFGSMSGEMHAFLERLLYASFVYTKPPRSIFPRQIKTGFIYTMNLSEESSIERGYDKMFSATEGYMKTVFGHSEIFCAYDTCQMADFSQVVMASMDQGVPAGFRVRPETCRSFRALRNNGVKIGAGSRAYLRSSN